MKYAVIVGMIVIGVWVLMGAYPAFKGVLDGVDTSGFGTLLVAYVGNMWWIMLVLGVVAVVSIWWTWGKR